MSRLTRAGTLGRMSFVGLVAVMVASFPSAALPVLSQPLMTDLGLSRTEFGFLLSLLGVVGVVAAAWVGGRADVHGPRKTLIVLFGLSGLSLLGLASSRGLATASLSLGIAGLANVLDHAPANRLIASTVPPGKRAVPMGVKASGALLGVFLAGATLPASEARLGWRATLMVAGCVFIAGGFLLVRLAVPDQDRGGGTAMLPSSTGDCRDLRWLVISAGLVAAGSVAVLSFLPVYAQDEGDMSAAAAGKLVAVAGLVGIAGRVAWAWMGDRVRDSRRPLATLGFASAGSVAVLLLGPLAGAWAYWFAAAAAGATMLAWPGLGMLATLEEAPPSMSGRATGLVLRGYMIGWALSPLLFGVSVDATGGYAVGWAVVGVAFVVAGLLPLARQKPSIPPRPVL